MSTDWAYAYLCGAWTALLTTPAWALAGALAAGTAALDLTQPGRAT